jgi:protease-4
VGAVVVTVVALTVGLCVVLGILSGSGASSTVWGSGDAVAVVYAEGVIGLQGPGLGAVDSQAVLAYIEQAEANRRVKAIVVAINSPGGTMVPAAEMYRAMREAEKPVVAVMGDVAASGGYLIACGADKIVAHPASITGSIGVYGELINAADLLDKLGIEGIIIRSGDSKATGNWFEHPTEEQLAIEQAIVDELYDLFVQAVAEGRGMDEAQVRALADGRPYTGQQAFELGLVDELGVLEDAIREAGRMGGIEGEPQVIEYRRAPSLLETWISMQQMKGDDLAVLRWLEGRFALPQARYVGP